MIERERERAMFHFEIVPVQIFESFCHFPFILCEKMRKRASMKMNRKESEKERAKKSGKIIYFRKNCHRSTNAYTQNRSKCFSDVVYQWIIRYARLVQGERTEMGEQKKTTEFLRRGDGTRRAKKLAMPMYWKLALLWLAFTNQQTERK